MLAVKGRPGSHERRKKNSFRDWGKPNFGNSRVRGDQSSMGQVRRGVKGGASEMFSKNFPPRVELFWRGGLESAAGGGQCLVFRRGQVLGLGRKASQGKRSRKINLRIAVYKKNGRGLSSTRKWNSKTKEPRRGKKQSGEDYEK